VDFVFIYFSLFSFILFLVLLFFFFILDLGKRYDVMLYMTVTQVTRHKICHMVVTYVIVTQSCDIEKNIEGSGTDNII